MNAKQGAKQRSTLHEFAVEILEFLAEASFYGTALPSTFEKYPYCAEDSKFIIHDSTGASTKLFLSSSFFYNTRVGTGNFNRLDSYIWRFFGPLVENTVACDVNGNLCGEAERWLGLCYVGGQFTVVKTNPFTWQVAFQYGFDYGLLEPLGIHGGKSLKFTNVFKSYPGAGFQIEDRMSVHSGGNAVWENELHVGRQLNRFQIFGTWNWAYDFEKNLALYHQWGCGLKLYI